MTSKRDRFSAVAPEAALLLGAGRAILLQLAHRKIGRAVAEHSDFAENPLGRLIHTLSYIYALSNGSPAQQRAMIEHVNRAHRPVHAPRGADEQSPAYSAFDPKLQLWVAATLYDSARVIGAQVLPGSKVETDAELYRQYARLGDALQMPTEYWPDTIEQFDRYFNAALKDLQVTEQTRALAEQLFTGSRAPWWIRWGLPLMKSVTIAQLPASVREGFGYDLDARTVRRNALVVGAARLGTRVLPRAVRYAPMRWLLRRIS